MSEHDNGYDRERAEQARDEAIERVDKHAEEAWRETADEGIRVCAALADEFTSEMVRLYLDLRDVETHDERALGPRMQAAARAGLIEPTDEFRAGSRVSRHRAPLRVWRSLVRRG